MKHVLLATVGLLALANAARAEDLNLDLSFAVGNDTMQVEGTLHQTNITHQGAHTLVNYTLTPSTLVVTPSGAYSAAAVQAMQSATYNAVMDVFQGTNTLNLDIQVAQPSSPNAYIPPARLTLSQTGSGQWSKDEGVIRSTTSGTPGCTQITPNGNQPTSGVYSVVLTNPASCDFKLPTVTVSGVEVAIGSYWQIYPGSAQAHPFPILPAAQAPQSGGLYIDDGFLLIQPDGVSYLLVDAGNASTSGVTAQTTANNVSMQLFGRGTTLRQPSPGSAADGYATATVFKAGSVIAIYDDSPDMSGNLQVAALIDSAIELGQTLRWAAEITP